MPRFYLQLTAAIGGFAVMALETVGFRLLATTFGSSLYVTGTLLGAVLVALTIGYWIGGRMADRHPQANFLYSYLCVLAFYIAALGIGYDRLALFANQSGMIVGSFLTSLVAFLPPMVILAMISPTVIRQLERDEGARGAVGGVYGLSTLGSMLGSLLTSLVFIPAYGAHNSLIIAGSLIGVTALIGMALARKPVGGALALAATASCVALFFFKTPSHPDIVEEVDSVYNTIAIRHWTHEGVEGYDMRLNNLRQCSRTISGLPEDDVKTEQSWQYVVQSASILANPKNILILGLSCGHSMEVYDLVFPSTKVVGVELDPEIVRLDKKYFGFDRFANLTPVVADARSFLRQTSEKFDVIEVDVFKEGDYIPFHVTTQEFFEEAASHLTEGGFVAIDVFTSPLVLEKYAGKNPFLDSISATVGRVLPYVYAIQFGETSNIILATRRKMEIEDVKHILLGFETTHPVLKKVLPKLAERIRVYESTTDQPHISTDDLSRIELLQGLSPRDD